jgi:hypothetical protein
MQFFLFSLRLRLSLRLTKGLLEGIRVLLDVNVVTNIQLMLNARCYVENPPKCRERERTKKKRETQHRKSQMKVFGFETWHIRTWLRWPP